MINIGPGKEDLRHKQYPRVFDMYPPDDVYMEDKDGRLLKVVGKNQKISFERALDLGIIKAIPTAPKIEFAETVVPEAKKITPKETTAKKKLETK